MKSDSQTANAAAPSLFKALRGVWSFTWRSQATARKLSLGLISMLAIAVLVFLTTSSPEKWERTHRMQMANPAAYLSLFESRLERAENPLRPEQSASLGRILTEEFGRTEAELRDDRSAELGTKRQRLLAEACVERIRERARTVLDESQFALWQSHLKRQRVERPPRAVDQGWDRPAPFYHWLIEVYFFMILPLNCVGACGACIRDELQADTLSFLTTRPLSRAQLLVVKFLSQTAWLQVLLLVQALLLFAAGWLRHIPGLGPLLLGFLGTQFLAIWAWGALGLFFGQVAKNYMALALVYGAVVEMGIGQMPTNMNTLSVMVHLKSMLGHNEALQGIFGWAAGGLLSSVGALLLAAGFFLTSATLLFTFKEYHHTTEMQK